MSQNVHVRIENGVGRITLNRPEALHALDLSMCVAMSEALKTWALDPKVSLVLLDHQDGTRGFCAGGDIRMLAQSGAGDAKEGAAFFAAEYRLNIALKTFPKPVVACLDGVTMGGGVGISVHGSHRLVSEKTVFAMPETGIGLFPDVGGSYFLPRLEGGMGMWLALTGSRLKGADVLSAGIGTHFMPSEAMEAFKAALLDSPLWLDRLVEKFSQPVGTPTYCEHRTIINTCFTRDSLINIFLALKLADDEWASAQGEILSGRSPFSMLVTHKAQKLGALMDDFTEVMRMEYRIASRIIKSHDFQEGVRAVLIDKDHKPIWNPTSVASADPEAVDAMFAPLDDDLRL